MTNLAPNKKHLALAASILFCAAIAGTSPVAFAADQATPSPAMHQSTPMSAKMVADSPEGRVKHLHDQLKITPAEEAQWQSVAQVMLANASAMKSAVKERTDMKSMSAIDDLRSYQAIVEAHAEGIKKLVIAFKPLYASMPEEQQKNADAVFGHRTKTSRAKPHG